MRINVDFLYQIYAIVDEIPYGKVTTYGDIAKLSGYYRNSRLMGKAMGILGLYGNYPCHRVVNSAGKLVDGWYEQRSLLEKEGVVFKENGNIDLKKYGWIINC